MKKSGLILLVFLSLVCFNFNVSAAFSGGDGSVSNPYQVTECSQLVGSSASVPGTKNYKLMSDIDCGAYTYSSLGRYNLISSGILSSYTFDGNNKVIRNLKVQLYSTFTGTIKNLYLENVNIIRTGSRYVGALAGSSSSTGKVINVHVTGSVRGTSNAGDIYVGGFFGRMDGQYSFIEKSSFNGIVNGTVTSGTGSTCTSIGGLVGFNNVETLTAITDSYTQGTVFGKTYSSSACLRVGGVIGSSYRNVIRTYSSATVIGFRGSTQLTGAGSSINAGIGGVAVYHSTSCLRCSDVNNYWDLETSGTSYSVLGTSKTSSQMKMSSTYSSWDFVNTWSIDSYKNEGYPFINGQSNVIDNTPPIGDPGELTTLCSQNGKVFLFPIQNKTVGSGNYTFNISVPEIRGCDLIIGPGENIEWISNTTIIVNNTNHTDYYLSSLGDSPLAVGDYTAQVICSCGMMGLGSNSVSFSVLSSSESNLNWVDMNGDNILYSRPVNKSDSVIAYFGSERVNTLVNYSVTKLGVGSSVVRSGQTDKGFIILNFSEAGDYTFKAYYGGSWHESGKNITVLPTESNNIPEAIIDFSSQQAVVGQELEFNHLSKDVDDQLIYTWDFGDGATSSYEYSLFEKNINSSLGMFNHSYSSPGVYTVSLNVQEVGRVQNAKSYFVIQVFKEGINVFPEISPSDGTVLTSKWVQMDGSDVLVLNCSQTSNNPLAESVAGGALYCSRLNEEFISLDNNLVGYSLFFNWSFGEDQYRSGYWNEEEYYNSVVFRTRFKDSGVHNVDLKVTYESGNIKETGFAGVAFSTGTTEFECVRDASSAFWRNLSANWDIHWIYNLSMASLPAGMCSNETYMSESWCCPNNMYCSDAGTCEPVEFMITCSELIDETSCENPDTNTAAGLFLLFPENEFKDICSSEINFDSYFDESSGAICSNSTYCGCTWDSEANNGAGVCKSSLYFESNCGNEEPVISTCTWAQEGEIDDRCDSEGIMIIDYVASSEGGYFDSGNGESLCENQRVEYPCSVSVQLPFFSWFSFVFSFLLIVGIYFVMKNK